MGEKIFMIEKTELKDGYLFLIFDENNSHKVTSKRQVDCDVCYYKSFWTESPYLVGLHLNEKKYICNMCGNTKIFTEKL